MGCLGEELKEGGQGDLQSKRHKKTEEEREGQESEQAARETVGSGRQLRPQVNVCVWLSRRCTVLEGAQASPEMK